MINQPVKKAGFTLIELLVAIGIITLLSSIAMVNLNSAREKARLARALQFEASVHHALGSELIGEWKLETVVSPTPDSSNYATHLFQNGVVNAGSGCISGGCINFPNGLAYYWVVNAPQILKFGIKPFTIAFWLKTSAGANTKYIVNESESATKGYAVYVPSAGNVSFTINDGSCGGITATSLTRVDDNQWHYIVAERTKGSGANQDMLKIFVDGRLDVATVPAAECTITNIGSFLIGAPDISSSNRYVGLLDDVRIYGTDLKLSQIQQTYAEGILAHARLNLSYSR